MEFVVMPDHLFGASVWVNGKWLGVVDERPLSFTIADQGTFQLVVELTPLATDPSGDVYPIPLARMVRVKNGAIVPPLVEADGMLHLRKAGEKHQLSYIYPKVSALASGFETLPLPIQTETADFDRDGRLDSVETFVTNLNGHVRVRSAKGQILLQDVYPDNRLRVEVTDLNRDGRPDLLIFWEEPSVTDPTGTRHMQMWDPTDGSLTGFVGYTGIRRSGAGDALVERKQTTPYRQVIALYRYSRKPGESAQFQFSKTEEKMLQRADTDADTVEAFLSSLEIGDLNGASLYLAKPADLPAVINVIGGKFYSHEIDTVENGQSKARIFEWIEPGYYDREKNLHVELVQQPDKVSEWKIRSIKQSA